ncbi:MAG: hypothetical protein IT298_00865 [Chloroflexi bacterium]|nr:hypothetical protein [Chloroflexota bacterium]
MTLVGLLLIAGAVGFLGFAYRPVVRRTDSLTATIARIDSSWRRDSVQFGVGVMIVAFSLTLAALIAVLDTRYWAMQWPVAASALLAILGFSQWLQLARRRMLIPDAHAAATAVKERGFVLYVYFTDAAFVVFGIGLANGGFSTVIAWGLVLAAVAAVSHYALTRGAPLFVPPTLLLVAGLALTLGR